MTNLGSELLLNEYLNNKKSANKIAIEQNVSKSFVYKKLREFNIPRRSLSESHIGIEYYHKFLPTPDSEDLAYILGIIIGDGCVCVNKNNNCYKILLNTTSKEFVDSYTNTMGRLGFHVRIKYLDMKIKSEKWNNQWIACTDNRGFAEWYRGIDIVWINGFLRNKKQKIEFVRGFYESEGSCYKVKTRGYYELVITNTNKNYAQLIFDLINDLGFSFRWYEYQPKNLNHKRVYTLHIRGGVKEIQRFINIVNPVIKRGGF